MNTDIKIFFNLFDVIFLLTVWIVFIGSYFKASLAR